MNPKDVVLPIALGGAGGGGGGGDADITKATLAPNFSTSTAYTAGDYVWHSGKMYRFTMAHEAGSWTGTDVEEAPLSAGISELKSEIDDFGDTYAKQDGSYDSMTVGNAKQLVATVGVEDKVPYLFRTTGGSADVGDRKTMEIVGGTVAWNQKYFNNILNIEVQGVTFVADSDGVVTVNGTSTGLGNCSFMTISESNGNLLSGHVYYLHACPTGGSALTYYAGVAGLVRDIGNGGLFKHTFDWPTSTFRFDFKEGQTFTNVKIYPQYIDLTQMFGSAIADYIYSLEQANAGAGVAWFRKLFPKPYYAYDAGTLMSVKTSANITTGFNQWDEEWEVGKIDASTGANVPQSNRIRSKNYIPVLPSTTYYFLSNNVLAEWFEYDANKNFLRYVSPDIKDTTFTTGNDCYYRRFCMYSAYGTTYNHDICINLSWDGERDGEYEPYVSHQYALDPDLELRGIPKLDSDNSLYYDGDTYKSDGTVTRRYGIRVLNGTEDWHSPDSSGHCWYQDDSIMRSNKTGVPYSQTMISTVKVVNNSYAFGDVTEPAVTAWGGTTASDDNYWYFAAPNVENTPTAIKEYLAANPVAIVYMLTTPTTETADHYQTPQIVDDFGTEEFVDTRDVPIPVGHDTTYQANLRAKLEMAPDSPSGDGDYIVRHSNGQNAYVPLTFPADELPAAPTEDGSYVLKATVADGAATYTWEAQS